MYMLWFVVPVVYSRNIISSTFICIVVDTIVLSYFEWVFLEVTNCHFREMECLDSDCGTELKDLATYSHAMLDSSVTTWL